jgi:hypothetical protein
VRLIMAIVGVLVVTVIGGLALSATILRPAPASTRPAGVRVLVAGSSIVNTGDRRHRLDLLVTIDSPRDLDECLGFALDQPFGTRRVEAADGGCVRPTSGRQTAALTFDRLTDDDIAFPGHVLVWGIPGGRCGLILETFGVCVVEQAGTAPVTLPSRSVLPSIGPLGSFMPLFSFPAP